MWEALLPRSGRASGRWSPSWPSNWSTATPTAARWSIEFGEVDGSDLVGISELYEEWPAEGDDLGTRLVLTLPYLEFGRDVHPEEGFAFDGITEMPAGSGDPDATSRMLIDRRVPADVVGFLSRWVAREVRVFRA